ncbi:alpha/beta fold hydrolase [Nonomuraea ferruginea]|uniref:Alpha/beta fold hydrolase n=1 Tax=Nonomuraea ferruginea TaxID=46174 RepID=A0ABT4TCG7_9ACTN|nr:alpha/beta fold hydrolase [Nonomuraea ferruginea]MDA0647227.1 alpha/beta fold hydrolase [Nonomuraea ferruginea]
MKKAIIAVLGTMLLPVAMATPAVADTGLSWQDCGDGLRCSRIIVPADWAAPRGKQITLGLAKLPARDPATRKGTLVLNLGGPAQQISILRQAKGTFADLTRWFDVVLYDPRGFEASTEVRCPDPAPYPANGKWVFTSRAAFARYTKQNHRFASGCAEAAGPLAGNLDTWQGARDLEAVRVALGERKLNYFGNSYGGVLGVAYAEYFPSHVGRMYLDSLIDHTNRSWDGWVLVRAKVKEDNLHRFADWCATDRSCALYGRDVLKVWDEVMARAARRPIPAPGVGAGATADAALIASRAAVSFDATWPGLAKSLAEADAGDASRFAEPFAGAPDPDLSRITMCADFPFPSTYREVKAMEARLRKTTPRIGWTSAWPMAALCAGLPKKTSYPPHPIRPRGLPPILIANGEYDDTSTPAYGRRIAAQLDGACYLPAKGGHALYWSGNLCVRDQVHRYLTTGQLPPAGTTCGPASS